MPERVIDSADVQLWSQSRGDPSDPPLLLLSQDIASSDDWPAALLDGFTEAGLRVLRYDQRDTGRSTHRDFEAHPYTIDTLVRDAVHVLDGWDIRKAHVFGFGMGGVLGQLLPIDHRERLLSANLAGCFALGVDFFGNFERAFTGEPTVDGLPTPRREFLESAADGDYAGHPHARLPDTLRERAGGLPLITTRTLVLQGTLDPLNPPPHGRNLADRIPGAEFTEIATLGLEYTEENCEALVKAVAGHCLR